MPLGGAPAQHGMFTKYICLLEKLWQIACCLVPRAPLLPHAVSLDASCTFHVLCKLLDPSWIPMMLRIVMHDFCS